jgi:hypothetical protein
MADMNAVEIRRAVGRGAPAVYESNLAQSLTNLSNRLAGRKKVSRHASLETAEFGTSR